MLTLSLTFEATGSAELISLLRARGFHQIADHIASGFDRDEASYTASAFNWRMTDNGEQHLSKCIRRTNPAMPCMCSPSSSELSKRLRAEGHSDTCAAHWDNACDCKKPFASRARVKADG